MDQHEAPDQDHHQSPHDWLGTMSRPQAHFAQAFDSKAALDTMAAGFGPWKAMVVAQMEWVTLASRRTQAYLGVPQRLARCRTRDEVYEEQMRFWQTAFEQYQDSSARVLQAWSDAIGASKAVPGVMFPPRAETASPSKSASLIQLPATGRKTAGNGTAAAPARKGT